MANRTLRCVVVTPEKAVIDTPADYVSLPLFDGQSGFLPGRAPLVGRMKPGNLLIRSAGKDQTFYVEGGIVQMKGEVITLLTGRAVPKAQIDISATQKLVESTPPSSASPAILEENRAARERAKIMLRVAKA